jgi:integrase
MCAALSKFLIEWRQHAPYNKDEDFIFASPKLDGKRPMWGQTMNANFVKPAAVALGLIAEDERFGWHCFRHSLSTWANDATGDITIPQTMLRHSDPTMTMHYTHGIFSKALAAQHLFMDQLLASASESAP